MPITVQDTTRQISVLDKKLERLTEDLLSTPGRIEGLSDRIEEVASLLQSWPDLPPASVSQSFEALRLRALRLHSLVESGLAFHCGALLTSPSIEYTYTPAGQILRGADDTNLNLQG